MKFLGNRVGGLAMNHLIHNLPFLTLNTIFSKNDNKRYICGAYIMNIESGDAFSPFSHFVPS
jgi:hypothetical protein